MTTHFPAGAGLRFGCRAAGFRFGFRFGRGLPGRRPRRLRTTPAMRRMVAEHRLHPADLILPAFVREGISEPVPISSMPGVVQHTRDTLKKAAAEAVRAGVAGIMLFGVPPRRRRTRSAQRAPTRTAFSRSPCGTCGPRSATISSSCRTCAWTSTPITGTAVCWTSEGRCRQRRHPGAVRRDGPGPGRRGRPCASGPSGMMDGQIGVVRDALDQTGHEDVSDPRLHGEVLLGLLRPLPRGRRLLAQGRPQDVPAGPGQRP